MSSEGAGRAPSEQEFLSRAALTAFRLNGQFLSVADELARPGGLTAARWQVLGAVLVEPLPVAGIARTMGITRQSVQRIADLLVERGLAEYTENPAHRRAKLLRATEAGATRCPGSARPTRSSRRDWRASWGRRTWRRRWPPWTACRMRWRP